MKSRSFLLLVFFFSAIHVFSQGKGSDTIFYTTDISGDSLDVRERITLKDGMVFNGIITEIKASDSSILFKSSLFHERHILIREVAAIKYYINKRSERLYSNYPANYFITPSAIRVKKGTWYLQDISITLLSVNYAMTDHWILGAGSLILNPSAFMVTTRVSFDLGNSFHYGVGYMFIGGLVYRPDEDHFQFVYGIFTIGNAKHNITINIGRSFQDVRFGSVVSGYSNVFRRLGILFEAWSFPSEGNYTQSIAPLIRIRGRRHYFDFGYLFTSELVYDQRGVIVACFNLRF